MEYQALPCGHKCDNQTNHRIVQGFQVFDTGDKDESFPFKSFSQNFTDERGNTDPHSVEVWANNF